MIRTVRIVPNYRKRWARRFVRNVASVLRSHGFAVAHAHTDATVCIGGDGTIFYANHRGRISGAVVGIGSASSAVCALTSMGWEQRLVRMLKRGKTQKRLSLEATLGSRTVPAINDIVVHSNDYRMIRVFIESGKGRRSFDGDGIIAATPLGSAAYAYSAGGKKLKSGLGKFELVPICPYKRAFRPKTIPSGREACISCDRSASLVIDGIFIGKIRHGEKVRIKKGKPVVFLV